MMPTLALDIDNNDMNAQISNDYSRFHPRRPLEGYAKLLDQNAVPIKVTIVDISRTGMGLVVNAPKVPGLPCAIAFDAVLDSMPKRINVWARIANCTLRKDGSYRVGVQFLDCDGQSKAFIDNLAD